MTRPRPTGARRLRLAADRSGIAALEFAIVAPFLLLVFGGAADFGLAMAGRSRLANAVAQGAQYAVLNGASVLASPAAAAATIAAIVTKVAQDGVSQAVAVKVTPPACYCVSGTPASLAATSTPLSGCTGTCSGASGGSSSPGVSGTLGGFVVIAASFTYQPLMPGYGMVASTAVSQRVTVRLQ